MSSKMTINSQLSTTEPKNKNDVDPGPRDPCVMAETRQIHTDY